MTAIIRLARSRLLRRKRRRGHGEWTQLTLKLDGVERCTCREPVAGTQFEKALAGPVRQDANDVAEVGLRIEAMQPRRGDECHQVARGLRVIVAADEHPSFATDRDAAELALGGIVVEPQPAVVVEARERMALPVSVAKGSAEQAALIANTLVLGLDPREECIGVRSRLRTTGRWPAAW